MKRDVLAAIDEVVAEVKADREAALKKRVDDLIESCCASTTGFRDLEAEVHFSLKWGLELVHDRHPMAPCGDGCSRAADYGEVYGLYFNEYFEAPWMGGLVPALPNNIDVFCSWPDEIGPSEHYCIDDVDDEDDAELPLDEETLAHPSVMHFEFPAATEGFGEVIMHGEPVAGSTFHVSADNTCSWTWTWGGDLEHPTD